LLNDGELHALTGFKSGEPDDEESGQWKEYKGMIHTRNRGGRSTACKDIMESKGGK